MQKGPLIAYTTVMYFHDDEFSEGMDELKKEIDPNQPVKFIFDELMSILEDYIPKNSDIPVEKIASKLELFMVELHMRIKLDPPSALSGDWGE